MSSDRIVSSPPGAVEPPVYLCCSQCGKRLKVQQFSGKRKFRCPDCSHVFQASHERETLPTPLPTPPAKAQDTLQPAIRPRRRLPWLAMAFVALAFGGGLWLGHDGFLGTSAPPARGFDDSGWREYDYPENQLKISLPRRPTMEDEKSRPKDAALALRAELPDSDVEFCLHVFPTTHASTQQPARAEEFEKSVEADYQGSKILSSRSFHYENCAAVEFRLKTPTGEALRRIVFTRGQTCVLSIAGSDFVRHDQSIKHFLHSLQLTEFDGETP